jgi:thiol-disulfide isomerase/thioredoxin
MTMTTTKAALAVLLITALPATTALANAKVGDRAANFSLPALDGGSVKLSDLKGKIVVVDFWASWCVPCRKELPALDALQKRYADAKKPVVILAVNVDKDRANAEKLLAAVKVAAIRILLDPDGKVAGAYDVPTMPSSFIIDEKGLVRNVHAGFSSGDERKFAEEIEALVR